MLSVSAFLNFHVTSSKAAAPSGLPGKQEHGPGRGLCTRTPAQENRPAGRQPTGEVWPAPLPGVP